MKRRKSLVYGFGPYDRYKENITEAIIGSLKSRNDSDVVTEVFETRFSRAMFLRTLRRHAPEIIIGMGQHPRARKLRLERKAVNLWGKRGKPHKPISRTGARHSFVNLRLPDTEETTITYNAGTYVCNFSMYVCLEYCRMAGGRYAFIHVPRSCEARTVASYVSNAVQHALAAKGDGS